MSEIETNDVKTDRSAEEEFGQLASEDRRGMVGEFIDFLQYNKKWWLLPIVLVILVLGALVLLGGSGFAPFIYTLF